MGLSKIIDENRRSADQLGWDPSWFGVEDWGTALVKAITAFQRAFEIKPDGWCDETTFRRILSERDEVETPKRPEVLSDHFIFAGERIPVPGAKIITMDEDGALPIRLQGERRRRYNAVERPPESVTAIIVHWDATSSAAVTRRVLEAKDISSNFCIDWDGVIYQYVDAACETYHAGIGIVNDVAIGIDLNCEVGGGEKTKEINRRLVDKGRLPRPIVDGVRINGWRPKPFLGLYGEQVAALTALVSAITKHTGVPLERPASTGDANDIRSLRRARDFGPGIYHHAEVDWKREIKGKFRRSGKWDTSNLDLDAVVRRAA